MKRLQKLEPLCLLLLLGCPSGDEKHENEGVVAPVTEPFGHFEGEVVSAWDDDGRNMTLRKDFAYVDPHQQRWEAASGSVVNGASIPPMFWSIIGGPFEGKYRNASVVHDVACKQMTKSPPAVHRMFYDACRCGGVGEKKAKLMYWAVYQFGPHWEFVSETRTREKADGTVEQIVVTRPVVTMRAPIENDEIAAQAEAYFETHDVSLAEIESLAPAEIQRESVNETLPESTGH